MLCSEHEVTWPGHRHDADKSPSSQTKLSFRLFGSPQKTNVSANAHPHIYDKGLLTKLCGHLKTRLASILVPQATASKSSTHSRGNAEETSASFHK